MRILFIACLAIITLICGSCFEKGDCVINNSNLLRIKLTNTKDKTAHPIKFTSIKVDSTSIVLYSGQEVSAIELPVNPSKTHTSFTISRADVPDVTLNVTYTNKTIITSAECGAFIYQQGVKLENNPFEGTIVKEVNVQLLRNAAVNFEIFF